MSYDEDTIISVVDIKKEFVIVYEQDGRAYMMDVCGWALVDTKYFDVYMGRVVCEERSIKPLTLDSDACSMYIESTFSNYLGIIEKEKFIPEAWDKLAKDMMEARVKKHDSSVVV